MKIYASNWIVIVYTPLIVSFYLILLRLYGASGRYLCLVPRINIVFYICFLLSRRRSFSLFFFFSHSDLCIWLCVTALIVRANATHIQYNVIHSQITETTRMQLPYKIVSVPTMLLELCFSFHCLLYLFLCPFSHILFFYRYSHLTYPIILCSFDVFALCFYVSVTITRVFPSGL